MHTCIYPRKLGAALALALVVIDVAASNGEDGHPLSVHAGLDEGKNAIQMRHPVALEKEIGHIFFSFIL